MEDSLTEEQQEIVESAAVSIIILRRALSAGKCRLANAALIRSMLQEMLYGLIHAR